MAERRIACPLPSFSFTCNPLQTLHTFFHPLVVSIIHDQVQQQLSLACVWKRKKNRQMFNFCFLCAFFSSVLWMLFLFSYMRNPVLWSFGIRSHGHDWSMPTSDLSEVDVSLVAMIERGWESSNEQNQIIVIYLSLYSLLLPVLLYFFNRCLMKKYNHIFTKNARVVLTVGYLINRSTNKWLKIHRMTLLGQEIIAIAKANKANQQN